MHPEGISKKTASCLQVFPLLISPPLQGFGSGTLACHTCLVSYSCDHDVKDDGEGNVGSLGWMHVSSGFESNLGIQIIW